MEKGDSKKPGSWWIDESQLVVVPGGLADKVKPKETGGPTIRSDR
jgi:hypothetical protein